MNRALFAVLAICTLVASAAGQTLTVKQGSPLVFETLAVKADVEEGVALIDVDQTFHNATPHVQEGIYRFRLPEDAVIHSFSLWIAGKEKQGQVFERKFARRIYDQIRRRRKDPALLEQIGWRTFKVSVFPIPAHQDVRLRLRYAHVVPDDLGLYRLEVPVIDGGSRVKVCTFEATVRDRRGLTLIECVDRPDAAVKFVEDVAKVHWVAERWKPDGPFVVRFLPRRTGLDLSVVTHREMGEEDGWFLVRVLPKLPKAEPLPRDVVFVFDRSGSMQGEKVEQARAALLHGLSTLRAGDRFNVVTFAADARVMKPGELVEVTPTTLGRAKRLARSIHALGGTNIDLALRTAVALREKVEKRLFLLVFLTDGEPTVGVKEPERIIERYRTVSKDDVRLFAFGVGEGAKHFLLTRLARGSRGQARYVREGENLEVPLSSLFSKLESPLLGSPSIRIEGVDAYDIVPRPLPDLFRTEALVLAGRFRGAGEAKLTLTGDLRTGSIAITVPVTFSKQPVSRPHVAQLWAKRKIDRLIDDLRITPEVREIRDSIVDLGVRYQVVTPYTSFLVVEPGFRLPDPVDQARIARRNASPFAGGSPGGRYRGPVDEVPPGMRRPEDPGSPSRPRAPVPIPPPGAVAKGRSTPMDESEMDDGSPVPVVPGDIDTDTPFPGGPTPVGPRAPSGGGWLGGTGGKGKLGSIMAFNSWPFWWGYNRDSVLGFRSGLPNTPAGNEIVVKRILPLLLKIHDDKTYDSMTRSHAIQALAKIGATRPELSEDIARRLIDSMNADVTASSAPEREHAVLALGLLGRHDPLVIKALIGRLRQRSVGNVRERCFAAMALGLLRIPETDPLHEKVTQAFRDGLLAPEVTGAAVASDLQTAVLVGMGLSGDPLLIPLLLDVIKDPPKSHLREFVRAHAVDALGRILERHPSLLTSKLFRDLNPKMMRAKRPVVSSWVIALGRVGACEGVSDDLRSRIIGTLEYKMKKGLPQASCFAIVSLGRIGGATESRKLASRIRDRFLIQHMRRGSYTSKPWAALALTLMGRSTGNEADRETIREAVREAFRGFKGDPKNRGAYALSLGLLGDRECIPDLRRLLESGIADRSLRGTCAIALACVGGPAEFKRVRAAADDPENRPFRRELAVALGLIGEPDTAGRLTEIMSDRKSSIFLQAEAATALAQIGDPESVDRLIKMFEDRMIPGLNKAYVIAALGMLADGLETPRLREFSRDVNYRALRNAMEEVLRQL